MLSASIIAAMRCIDESSRVCSHSERLLNFDKVILKWLWCLIKQRFALLG